MKSVQSIELFFREGSSDKVYKASIDEVANGKYMVNFAYGRRGNTLVTGSKTGSPVSYDKAADVYAKLVNSKTGKGYQPDPNAKAFTGTPAIAERDTGVRPQLLNEIEEADVEKYINDPEWGAQEKYDGRRRLLIRDGQGLTGANRKGLAVAISQELTNDLTRINETAFVIDGEAVGEKVIVFDILSQGLKFLSYNKRHTLLGNLLPKGLQYIEIAPLAVTTVAKRNLYKRLQRENAEGIVFKKLSAAFSAARPNSGGDQLKFKFCATASCIVLKVNGTKRSVALGVLDNDGNMVEVGNVTVYPNQQIPKADAVVEVKYLYYFPGGSLFQPVLLEERDDIDHDACTINQLKVKREEVDA